jgi:hypothetical protein
MSDRKSGRIAWMRYRKYFNAGMPTIVGGRQFHDINIVQPATSSVAEQDSSACVWNVVPMDTWSDCDSMPVTIEAARSATDYRESSG